MNKLNHGAETKPFIDWRWKAPGLFKFMRKDQVMELLNSLSSEYIFKYKYIIN